MFAFRERVGAAEIGFTDRHGGVSDGPWGSLNLGSSNGDDPDRVERNLALVAQGVGVGLDRLRRTSQVHGSDVLVATADDVRPRDLPPADAIVTAEPDLAVLVRVADCTPVVLVAPDDGIVGVVHAGRVGMVGGVVDAAVAQVRGLGAGGLRAWVGPRACGGCYEVPAQMRDDVADVVPEAYAETRWGTPALDVGAGVVAQLRRLDVEVEDLADRLSVCTIEDDRYFSYRRQGQRSGRLGAVVRWRS